MEELKKCPFCGESAICKQISLGVFIVICKNWCVRMPPNKDSGFTSDREAIKAWNRRAE